MDLSGMISLSSYDFAGLGKTTIGKNGCKEIYKTADERAVIAVLENDNKLIYFPTEIGIPTFYPLKNIEMPGKISGVLMDLDGTSVKSEHFWIWVIQQVIAGLCQKPDFEFAEEDLPHVSGHSVSEHLQYSLNKYCRDIDKATLVKARDMYFKIVHRELQNVLENKEINGVCFEPAPFLKEFLLTLKNNNVKIGLVSSGLYEKSIPEISAAFRRIQLGEPAEFYDGIVTAGFSIGKGRIGTLGELEPKPHPWLYAEMMHALNVPKNEVVGLEDSGAGVLSLISAQIPAIGIAGGNIESGGEKSLCSAFFNNLKEALDCIMARV
ncbi:MAG: HAD family phosphatase [Phycisphaerae bacterium]|nr:HAD family phosphatase [Phycisphaerae bacterium]